MNSLEANIRTNETKGQLNTIRDNGNVPAIIYGGKDELVSKDSVDDLNNRLKNQKGIEVVFSEIKNANHFFHEKEDELKKIINTYVAKNTELI